jgi:hypothetical protein
MVRLIEEGSAGVVTPLTYPGPLFDFGCSAGPQRRMATRFRTPPGSDGSADDLRLTLRYTGLA